MKARVIAEYLGAVLKGDGDINVVEIASLDRCGPGKLVFVEKYGVELENTAGACIIVPLNFESVETDQSAAFISVREPKYAFAAAAKLLTTPDEKEGIDDTARLEIGADVRAKFVGSYVSVGEGSTIAEDCMIHDGVKIGENVRISRGTVIHPNCTIYDRVTIGTDCVIHAGAVIGADGFGYVRSESGEYIQFPHVGTVVIGDRVEIGANTCVDRGALGETSIGDGTKIDNLVQVGHNVKIGRNVVIAAQTGISGSTVIEDNCIIGGQVGMGDHAVVKSGAIIGSQAGILPGKIVREGIWWGTPVQPLAEFKRQNAHLKGIARLKDEVKELKKKVQ
jgi:UDP-3-O-[3-hydroxymyristoyl] glucosamine N-acyltransferase